MNVVIGCETSGEVREQFRALGHYVWSCDVLPAKDGSRYHFEGDLLEFLGCVPFQVDLLIAHPPCTYLTSSAAWAFGDGPYHQRVKPETLVGAARREAREKAVAFARALLQADIPKIAIENPIGHLSTALRKPDQVIQPYQFGHDASKATCLWLKGLPTLRPTSLVAPKYACRCGARFDFDLGKYDCPNCRGASGAARQVWANQTNSGQNRLSPSADRWQVRSHTYTGIARAMAEQWGREKSA